MPYTDWPPPLDHWHVREAARNAVWGFVRPAVIGFFVFFAVASINKLQNQMAEQGKALAEQSRAIANLTESVKGMQANRATLTAVAKKVGAHVAEPAPEP